MESERTGDKQARRLKRQGVRLLTFPRDYMLSIVDTFLSTPQNGVPHMLRGIAIPHDTGYVTTLSHAILIVVSCKTKAPPKACPGGQVGFRLHTRKCISSSTKHIRSQPSGMNEQRCSKSAMLKRTYSRSPGTKPDAADGQQAHPLPAWVICSFHKTADPQQNPSFRRN